MLEKIRTELSQNSILVPPNDPFEVSGTHEEIVARLVSRFERIVKKAGIAVDVARVAFLDLLHSVSQPRNRVAGGSLIFYGSSIYARKGGSCSDIDVARFGTDADWEESPPLLGSKVLQVHEGSYLGMCLEDFVGFQNTVLVFSYGGKMEFVKELREFRKTQRKQISFSARWDTDSPRLVEMLLALSLNKILEKQGHGIETEIEPVLVDPGERLTLSPKERAFSVIDTCAQFQEKELREMTHQALRRIRVKEGKIRKITDGFLRRVDKARY